MTDPEPPLPPVHEIRFSDHTVIVPPHRLRDAISQIGDSTEIETDALARGEDALDQISDEFTLWMNDECETLESARAIIRCDGPTPDMLEALFVAAHDIRGHAALFGYPLAGMIAGTLCRLLSDCPDGQVPLPLVERHVDAIRAVVREGVEREDDETGGEIHRRLACLVDAHLAPFAGDGTTTTILPTVEAPPLQAAARRSAV